MCFSASASFGAGVVLAAVGIIAIKKTTSASQLAFAFIPFVFCFQQISEGFLWLALTNSDYAPLKKISTGIFLFFAQVAWPLLLPFAILKMDKKYRRKKIQIIWVVLGIILSITLAYCLFTYPVEPTITGLHISYNKIYPDAINRYCGFGYIIATVTPAFFSGTKKMWTLGMAILISYIITAFLYEDYIVSVWCFFASFISILVAYILYKNKNPLKVIKEG